MRAYSYCIKCKMDVEVRPSVNFPGKSYCTICGDVWPKDEEKKK